MARTRFGRAGGDAWPAAQVTTYVTAASTDQLFIPGNQAEGDNPDSGSMAQRLTDCQNLVGNRDDNNQATTLIALAVQPGTLANW